MKKNTPEPQVKNEENKAKKSDTLARLPRVLDEEDQLKLAALQEYAILVKRDIKNLECMRDFFNSSLKIRENVPAIDKLFAGRKAVDVIMQYVRDSEQELSTDNEVYEAVSEEINLHIDEFEAFIDILERDIDMLKYAPRVSDEYTHRVDQILFDN